MSKVYKLAIENNDIFETTNNFFKDLLDQGTVDALLLPQESVNKTSLMQTLVKTSHEVSSANPFAPMLMSNSAALVSQLTVDNPEETLGVVLRSCEIRAVVELVKLKQINLDKLLIISVDCPGTYESNIYQELIQEFKDSKNVTREFFKIMSDGQPKDISGCEVRLGCQGCEYPSVDNFDLAINFFGCDISKEIIIQVKEGLTNFKPESLKLQSAADNSAWQQVINKCRDGRTKKRDEIFEQVLGNIKNVKSFLKELEHCRRCYNCRKECPICYCRECIFDSLTFEHASSQYFSWAEKRGKIRMPTDTLLYHITRMNHMVISCVGCGQCTSSCPNKIPIAKYFKAVGFQVQKVFDYQSGRSIDEEIPQSTFKEDEFPDVGHAPKSKQ